MLLKQIMPRSVLDRRAHLNDGHTSINKKSIDLRGGAAAVHAKWLHPCYIDGRSDRCLDHHVVLCPSRPIVICKHPGYSATRAHSDCTFLTTGSKMLGIVVTKGRNGWLTCKAGERSPGECFHHCNKMRSYPHSSAP